MCCSDIWQPEIVSELKKLERKLYLYTNVNLLIEKLVATDMITLSERNAINSSNMKCLRFNKLFNIILTKSPKQMRYFSQALFETGQKYAGYAIDSALNKSYKKSFDKYQSIDQRFTELHTSFREQFEYIDAIAHSSVSFEEVVKQHTKIRNSKLH